MPLWEPQGGGGSARFPEPAAAGGAGDSSREEAMGGPQEREAEIPDLTLGLIIYWLVTCEAPVKLWTQFPCL